MTRAGQDRGRSRVVLAPTSSRERLNQHKAWPVERIRGDGVQQRRMHDIGDYILPALAARTRFCGYDGGGKVRTVIIDEDSEDQLLTNLRRREGPEQLALRARVSWLYGRWLKEQAQSHGAAVVRSLPWDTTFG
jgi:hypothetical protein